MTPYVRLLSAALSTAGRSVLIMGSLVCSMHTCEGLASYTLTPTSEGMQLKTPQGKTVFEYKTKIPADLKSPSAAYFDPVNSPSGERVSNAAPDDHPWHRGIFLGILNSEFRTPVDTSKLPPNHVEGAFNVKRADFWAWGLYAPRDNRVIKNRDIRLINADEKHAELEIHNDWLVDDQKMVDETDRVSVAEVDGVYVIDLSYRIAPVVDFVLSQTAFGGFAFQAQKYGDSYYSDASGKVDLARPALLVA